MIEDAKYLYVSPIAVADGTNDHVGLQFPLTRT